MNVACNYCTDAAEVVLRHTCCKHMELLCPKHAIVAREGFNDPNRAVTCSMCDAWYAADVADRQQYFSLNPIGAFE